MKYTLHSNKNVRDFELYNRITNLLNRNIISTFFEESKCRCRRIEGFEERIWRENLQFSESGEFFPSSRKTLAMVTVQARGFWSFFFFFFEVMTSITGLQWAENVKPMDQLLS
jgi:hypothetical protein